MLTSDAVAAIVLRCGQVLAENGGAETVNIPGRRDDGSDYVATLLIGPASQIIVEDAPGVGGELADDDAIRDMDALIRRYSPTASATSEPIDAPDWLEDL